MQKCATTLNSLCCQASLVAPLNLVTSMMPCDSGRADLAGAGALVEHAVSGRHSRFAPHAFATQEAICVFSGSLINSTGKPHADLCAWTMHRLEHSAHSRAPNCNMPSPPARQLAALQEGSISALRCLALLQACQLLACSIHSSSLTMQGVHHGFVVFVCEI